MVPPATVASMDATRGWPRAPEDAHAARQPAGCVLVVDDDPLQRSAIADALHRSRPSYDVVHAGSVAEARKALAEGDFILALVDYYLGDGLGLELVGSTGDVPVVVVTGAGNEEIAIEAMHAGAYDYIVKDHRSGYLTALPATIEHVLARTRAERAAAARTEELARANRELEEFAYVVSHDLKTPLRAIKGFIAVLREDAGPKLGESENDWLARIDRSAGQMDRLIDELLDYSRIGRTGSGATVVDTGELVAELIAEIEQTQASGDARILVEGELPAVHAAEVRVRQLFQNLIGNAVKFRGAEPPVVRISARSLGPMVEFSVADNGIGIGEEHRESIFRVFSRVGRADEYEGTGIGLSVCKKICEQHGGRIQVESRSGEGANFLFTLPRAPWDGA